MGWGGGERRNFISFGTEVFRNIISLSFADNAENSGAERLHRFGSNV